VAVGHEGTRAELAAEGQRLAVVAFSVLDAASRRDVTGEAQDVGLAGASARSGVSASTTSPPGCAVYVDASCFPLTSPSV
jgi:hypothetical protein